MTEPLLESTVTEPTEPKRSTFGKSVLGGALGCAVVLGLWGLAGQSNVSQPAPDSSTSTEMTAQDTAALTDFESAVMKVAEQSKNAVVTVVNKQSTYDPFNVFSQQSEFPADESGLLIVGEGSGVVYKIDEQKAYIVTNFHVIENAEAVEIILADGTMVEGTLVGQDSVTDLALVTIDAQHATATIPFADSSAVKIGSLAIAIGSPLGIQYSNTVTQGIISGLDRKIDMDTDYDGIADWSATLIQTDAAINPGNSGGALLDKNGHLVGINTIKNGEYGIEGMGFAIPSNDVQDIVTQLETHGEVLRPKLGIVSRDVAELSYRSRTDILKLPEDIVSGVAVAELEPNGAASKAGIEPYDVIIKIDDTIVDNTQSLIRALYNYNVGDTVQVTLLRKGTEQVISVKLDELIETVDE
ncbi:MAG: trypsin-like peptidase domain-containing protein [Aerococcaceae bacterium]|nr:trypsin-like peptidase domain-containing protein [Aerococcaceae bacterium]